MGLFDIKPPKKNKKSKPFKPIFKPIKPIKKPRMKNLIFGYDRPKPVRKVKGKLGMNWAQSKRRFPKMSPFGDADRDGVKNWLDCRPFDIRRQGGKSTAKWRKKKKALTTAAEKQFGKTKIRGEHKSKFILPSGKIISVGEYGHHEIERPTGLSKRGFIQESGAVAFSEIAREDRNPPHKYKPVHAINLTVGDRPITKHQKKVIEKLSKVPFRNIERLETEEEKGRRYLAYDIGRPKEYISTVKRVKSGLISGGKEEQGAMGEDSFSRSKKYEKGETTRKLIRTIEDRQQQPETFEVLDALERREEIRKANAIEELEKDKEANKPNLKDDLHELKRRMKEMEDEDGLAEEEDDDDDY